MSRWLPAARGLLEASLAALFPADCFLCGEPLPWRQRGSVCLPCWAALPWAPGLRIRPGPLRAVLWAADYDGAIRSLVHGLKFESMDYLGDHLGAAMAARLAPLLLGASPSLAPEAAPVPRPDMIVPVPLHWWRRGRRGYNQALLLAAPLSRATSLPLVPRFLVRRRAGRRQLGLSRRDRLRSLEGCYLARRVAASWPRRVSLAGRTVLLVDDVVTTGATLEACARALLRAGAGAVVACVLARTRRGGG